MKVQVLREPDDAQRFLLQGLWFQRAASPAAATVKHVLEWMLEMTASGQPVLPIGVVADFGHAAFGADRDARANREAPILPGLAPTLLRSYEDHVLGKLYADWSFERASDAMRRFQGRDRALGLTYLLKQFRERCQLGGVEMSPGIIRGLRELEADELLRRGWDALVVQGPMPLLVDTYEALTAAGRRLDDVLALEDVIALEQRTALAELGQYVAHRQVLLIASRLIEGLPREKLRPPAGRREVPTRVLDEDTYPVGGFASIATRGSVESLLHSQLAFMEPDPDQRPDLFDMKYLRDELYYYSRDENQFLRRRRTFVFGLYPDLTQTRFKDPDLPVQRIVLILALVRTAVLKLTDWLGADALHFEINFVASNGQKPLANELSLMEMLLHEQIESGIVTVRSDADDLCRRADRWAQRSICHLLALRVNQGALSTEYAGALELLVAGPRPELRTARGEQVSLLAEDSFDCWTEALTRLLEAWV